MILTPDQQQVKALLTETITLLCKNGLHFQSEFSIEGLIGITLDQEEVFLVSIRETIKCDNNGINIKANGHAKGEQIARASPTLLRSKRHDRIYEPNYCSDTSINSSHDHANNSSACLDDSGQDKTDSSEVKMEFSKPDHSEHSHSNFEEESQSCISLPLTVHHNLTEQDAHNMSNETISSENVHSKESLEPLAKRLKRLCRNAVTKTNDHNDKVSDRQESPVLDLKVCKSEPLDVVEIPDEEVESSMNSENSYLMYLSMYRSGRGGGCNPSDAGFATQDDLLQMNQHLLPGCSSWSSVSRTVDLSNRDKMLQLRRCSKATVSMAGSTDRPTATVNRLTAGPTGELLHMLYHHGKYVCQLCGKQMQRKRDIRAHMASKHFMAKDFCCKLCGAEYGYKYNLQQHMKMKHRTQLNEADCC